MGATVIELKSDLRRELDYVLARLPAYLTDAASRSRSPRPVTGLATDGATFIAYALKNATLQELAHHGSDPVRPEELMAWLEPLLSDRPDVLPEPRAVAQAFGRASLTFGRARLVLDRLWAALRHDPEVRLKRDLWAAHRRLGAGAVWPIVGAQSGSSTTSTCVLFGRGETAGAHSAEIDRWEGHPTRRDADEAEATRALTHSRAPWPRPRTLVGASPYRARFRQGDGGAAEMEALVDALLPP